MQPELFIPVGYLLTYPEFSDVKGLANPLLSVTKLPLFALFATFTTILTDLMGAVTAVLPIRILHWVETKRAPKQRFDGLALNQPPQGSMFSLKAAVMLNNANPRRMDRKRCDPVGHVPLLPTSSLDTSIELTMLHQIQLENITTTTKPLKILSTR